MMERIKRLMTAQVHKRRYDNRSMQSSYVEMSKTMAAVLINGTALFIF